MHWFTKESYGCKLKPCGFIHTFFIFCITQEIMARKFQRHIEDFKCSNCGVLVEGNGYTDHCPECLEGMHVDNNPGDRASECHGAMKVVQVEYKSGNFIIYYKCKKCGIKKRFMAAQNDNKEALMAVFEKNIKVKI